jgi:hypothetical protein
VKGFIELLTVIMGILVLVGGITMLPNDDVKVIQSTEVLSLASDESIIPLAVVAEADMSVEEVGSDFKIECDKNVYTGYSSIEVVCSFTNVNDYIAESKELSVVSEYNIKTSKILLYNDEIITNKYCTKYTTEKNCYTVITNKTENETGGEETICNDVQVCSKYEYDYGAFEPFLINSDSAKGLYFEPFETKVFKFIIDVPINSQGKFDVLAGDTTLDPWWDVTYNYRARLYENKTYEFPVSVNDTYGINGNIFWAKTWNESYGYSNYGGFTGSVAIANETDEKSWENETALTGHDVTDIWGSNAKAVWHMGEASGNAMDSTSNNNDAVNMSDVGYSQAGRFGDGYYLDGDDYVGFTDSASLSPTTELVISVWVNPDVAGVDDFWVSKDQQLVATQRAYYLETAAGGVARCLINDGAGSMYVDSVNPITASAWSHVLCKYKASFSGAHPSMEIYVNGVNDTNPVLGGAERNSIQNTNIAMRIGSSFNGFGLPTDYYTGYIDEVRIYDDADLFTKEVIEDLYFNGVVPNNLTWFGAAEANAMENATVTNSTYSPEPYETLNTTFTLNITTNDDATVTGVLNWNGTDYSSFEYNTTPKVWNMTRDVIPPIVETGGETVNFFWNLTFTYPNGTSYANVTSGVLHQDVNYAYYFSAPTANITTGITGDAFNWNATHYNFSSLATIYNLTAIFNNLSYTPTEYTGGIYSATTTLPILPGYYIYKYGFTVLYESGRFVRNSTDGGLTVTGVNITDCSSGTPIFRFDVWDEENVLTGINAKFYGTFRVYADYPDAFSSFNITKDYNTTHFICIEPNTTSSITIDADIRYDNESYYYPPRYYFMRNAVIDNVTDEIDLFLLNSTYATNIQFLVVNANSIEQSDVLVTIQRNYEEEGLYRTVAMGLTADDGYTNIRLRPYDIYYRPIVSRNGTVLRTFSPIILTTVQNILTISSELIGDYWKYHDKITYACSFTNATGVLQCDAIVSDGTSLTFKLEAFEIEATSSDLLCSETGTSSAVTLLCNLGNMTGRQASYKFWAVYSDNNDMLVEDMINGLFSGGFGVYGLLFMVMLVVSMVMVSLFNPTVALIACLISIVMGLSLGLMTISTPAVISLILVIIIGIYKVRS